MVISLASICILTECRLGNHRCPSLVELCYQIDSFIGTVGNKYGIFWHAQSFCQQLLQFMWLRFRIMTDHVEMLHNIVTQLSEISPVIHIGTEVQLNLIAITKGVVTVSEYHRF